MPTVPIPAGSIRHAGGCLQPVLLRGRVDHIDGSTGELIHRYTTVHEPGGLLPVACKTRRASRCAPCAEVYRADTYQLIRAGLTGGKGVPTAVAQHPCVFVTFTAPSFGPVHAWRVRGERVLACRPRRNGRTCPHGVRLSCNEKHARDDDRLGEPLCPDCYDYTGSVLFNAYAPELWRRFTITLRRTLARRAGLTGKAFVAQARLSYAKVAEYQRRGVVHFHAIVRLDGPAGPSAAPPSWATLGLLTDAIGQAARAVQVRTPAAPRLPLRTLTRGGQLDIRPVTSAGELTDTTVAGYVAKYATKAAECTGTLDRRVTPADRLDELPVRDHARRHIAECLRLGRLPQFTDLRLAAWAHMLGFRGHFSTQSRAYSITLGSLRADRADHQRERAVAAGLRPTADDTTLVIADWHFAGRGDPPSVAAMLAAAAVSAPASPPGGALCPAPADRARGRRGPGHLPQQALRAAGQRRRRLHPHRRIAPYPAHRPGGVRLQAARRKDRRVMTDAKPPRRRRATGKDAPRLRQGVMKRGNTWSYVIRVKDPETGVSKPRWVGGFATEEAAKAARDESRVKARKGEYVGRNRITVAAYSMTGSTRTRWRSSRDPAGLPGLPAAVRHAAHRPCRSRLSGRPRSPSSTATC